MNPRVLFVSHTARWAGPTNSLLLLLRELHGSFDLHVLMPGEGDFSRTLADEGFSFTSLPTLSKTAIPGIFRLVRTHGFDLVYGNNTSGACRNALIAAKLARVPFICHIREMSRGEDGRRFAFLRFADATIAVSAACAASVPEFRGKPRYMVHNGIARVSPGMDRAAARQHLLATTGLFPDLPILVSVSHLTERKGQEHAIRALAHLEAMRVDAQLLLVGSSDLDPAYGERLRELVRELGLEARIAFAGFRRDVLPLLQGADLFVHTAMRDPHPRAVLEAMAVGLPVVAFATDGVAETVVSGETGTLVPAGDATNLAFAAADVLSDPQRAAEMGRRGRERIDLHFSAERTAADVAVVIERTLGWERAGPAGSPAHHLDAAR